MSDGLKYSQEADRLKLISLSTERYLGTTQQRLPTPRPSVLTNPRPGAELSGATAEGLFLEDTRNEEDGTSGSVIYTTVEGAVLGR